MSKVKFAVIGCGHIGPRHAQHIDANAGAELAYVCDVKEDRAFALAKKYNCKYVTDYKELLDKDIDVVNICTPNDSHARISIDFLNAKKNVVCEKPMSLLIEDGERMIEVAKKNNVNLFIVKQNRFNPPIQAAQKAIKSGKLGKSVMSVVNVFWNRHNQYYESSDWKGTKDMDGGALFTQCSHFIDLMLQLFGPAEKVMAMTDNHTHPSIEIEDTGVVLIRFKSGAVGTINYTTSVYERNIEGSISLFGSDGLIKIGGEYLNTIEYWNINGYPLPEIEKGNPVNDYGYYKGSMSNHDKVIQNVVDVMNGNGKIHATGEEGLETTKLICAVYDSCDSGKEVIL